MGNGLLRPRELNGFDFCSLISCRAHLFVVRLSSGVGCQMFPYFLSNTLSFLFFFLGYVGSWLASWPAWMLVS